MQIRKAELKDFDQVMAILQDGRTSWQKAGLTSGRGTTRTLTTSARTSRMAMPTWPRPTTGKQSGP